jgi:hypothetical protein
LGIAKPVAYSPCKMRIRRRFCRRTSKWLAVHMPGEVIAIEIGDELSIRMTGGVTRVAGGVLAPEMVDQAPAG